MGSKKQDDLEKEVMKLLDKNPKGLTFKEIYNKLQKREEYFRRVGSYSTLSQVLKTLQKKGFVSHDIDTRNYILTGIGKLATCKYQIIDHIASASFMDCYSDWRTWSIYIFIEAEEKAEPAMIRIPHKRLEHRQKEEHWLFDILECAEEMNLVKQEELATMTESKLKEIWDKLLKGTKRIMLVESFNPQLLFEELLSDIEKKKD